jgi:hypothetical protein
MRFMFLIELEIIMRLRLNGNITKIYMKKKKPTSNLGLESVLDGFRLLNQEPIGKSLGIGS